MLTLFEAGVEVLTLLLLLRGLQALIGVFGLVGVEFSIHDMHVVNTVYPLCPEVSDEEIPFQLPLVLHRGPFEIVSPYFMEQLVYILGSSRLYVRVKAMLAW